MGKSADTAFGTMSVPIDTTTLDTEVAALQTSVTNLQAGVGVVLPTADPHVAGHLWASAGVVTVSAG